MGKPKRKPRPTMPDWWWLKQDGCWFCKNQGGKNRRKRDVKTKTEKGKTGGAETCGCLMGISC